MVSVSVRFWGSLGMVSVSCIREWSLGMVVGICVSGSGLWEWPLGIGLCCAVPVFLLRRFGPM